MGPGADEDAATVRQLEADLAVARAAAKDIAGQLQLAYIRGWAECEAHHGLDGPGTAAVPHRGGQHRRPGDRHLFPVPSALAGLAVAPFAAGGVVARHAGAVTAAASITAVTAAGGVYALAPDVTSPPAAASLPASGQVGGWLDPPVAATRIPVPAATRPVGVEREPLAGVNAAVASHAPPVPVTSLIPGPARSTPVAAVSPAAAPPTPAPSTPPVFSAPPSAAPPAAPSDPGSDPGTPDPSPVWARHHGGGGVLGGVLGQPAGRHHRREQNPAPAPGTPDPSPVPSETGSAPGSGGQ